ALVEPEGFLPIVVGEFEFDPDNHWGSRRALIARPDCTLSLGGDEPGQMRQALTMGFASRDPPLYDPTLSPNERFKHAWHSAFWWRTNWLPKGLRRSRLRGCSMTRRPA